MRDTARFFLLVALSQVCFPTIAQAPAQPEPAQKPTSVQRSGQNSGQSSDSSDAVDKANQSLHADTDNGVVTNQTITVAGQDFYQYFVAAWRDKEASERYTVSIHERPSARWGNEVWIEFAQRRVFRTYLPPARASIRPISEEAAEVAYQAVMQADLERMLIPDADLGRDEF